MSRRPTLDSQARSKRLDIRLTPDDASRLASASQATGESRNEIILRALRAEMDRIDAAVLARLGR